MLVRHEPLPQHESNIDSWCAAHAEGVAGIVSTSPDRHTDFGSGRVSVLRPEEVKGLEFDLVVLDRPASFGTGVWVESTGMWR